jgi:hypothetical protein
VRYSAVVTQLRAGDRDQPVGHNGPCVLEGLAQPAAAHDRGEQRHRQRAAGHAGGDRGDRCPAGFHQGLSERAGHAEGDRGGNREGDAEAEGVIGAPG